MSREDPTRDRPGEDAIVCTLTEDERPERREQVRSTFVPHLEAIEENEDGFTFRFEATEEALAGVMEFVRLENRCCAHGRYEISVTPFSEPNRLYVSGPEGSKALFEEEIERIAGEFDVPLVTEGSA